MKRGTESRIVHTVIVLGAGTSSGPRRNAIAHGSFFFCLLIPSHDPFLSTGFLLARHSPRHCEHCVPSAKPSSALINLSVLPPCGASRVDIPGSVWKDGTGTFP